MDRQHLTVKVTVVCGGGGGGGGGGIIQFNPFMWQSEILCNSTLSTC